MANPGRKRAGYAEVLATPAHQIAEVIDGELHVSPRPGGPHAEAASALVILLGPPFKLGRQGPGGWILLFEPELHLGRDIVVPDLAGWRRERLPAVSQDAYFTLPPDWVCEVLSRSTSAVDRAQKLPIYARAGVRHVWLIDATRRRLEVLRLDAGAWRTLAVHHDDERVRAEPFEAIELELGLLWASVTPPGPRASRAEEPTAAYGGAP